MKRMLAVLAIGLGIGMSAPAAAATAEEELSQLVNEFLVGAATDAAVHERFWADELIYTSSSGKRFGKAEIMKDLRSAPPPEPDAPKVTYSAEELRVQPYGDMAVVAFRLVGTTETAGKKTIAKYLNTGTFQKRDGRWQAVAWQATRFLVPEAEELLAITEARTALDRAIRTGDDDELSRLTDDSFIWTRPNGVPNSRQQTGFALMIGALKEARLEADSLSTSLYGETAIVRGLTRREHLSAAGAATGVDPKQFISRFTLTLVKTGGAWKAVALQTTQP